MIRAILEKWACKHDWKECGKVEKKNTFTDNVIAVDVLYICTKCGKMRKVTYE